MDPPSYATSDSPAPRKASTWEMLPSWWPSGYREATDIAGRRVSEVTNYPAADYFSAAGMIAPRKASVWDAVQDMNVTHESATRIGRRMPTWTSATAMSGIRASASQVRGRTTSCTSSTMAMSSQDYIASTKSLPVSTVYIAEKETALHYRRQWDALGARNKGFIMSWFSDGAMMGSDSKPVSPTGDTPASDENRMFYAGNIDYIFDMDKGKREMAMADIETIMYIYGVENTSAQDVVNKIDPKKCGIFSLNYHNKQILLASNIKFSKMKDPGLSNLRHASKCDQENLLSPSHFHGYLIAALKGTYIGHEPKHMILGMYSILGVLEGPTNRKLTTKDVEIFARLWRTKNEDEANDLINMVKDDYNGEISCMIFYNLLYYEDLFGKQRIQMFDTLGPQNPSLFFPLIDKDEDGFLSSNDLRSFAAIFGRFPSDEAIDRVVRKLGMDGDGKISLEDFRCTMEPIFDGMTWEFWLVAILLTFEL